MRAVNVTENVPLLAASRRLVNRHIDAFRLTSAFVDDGDDPQHQVRTMTMTMICFKRRSSSILVTFCLHEVPKRHDCASIRSCLSVEVELSKLSQA